MRLDMLDTFLIYYKELVKQIFSGLVISDKKGEFKVGFDKSGSTREHTLLLKTLGVNQLIVVINKMNEESVKWNDERYNEINKNKLHF